MWAIFSDKRLVVTDVLLFRWSWFSMSINWISLQQKFSCILVAQLVTKLNSSFWASKFP